MRLVAYDSIAAQKIGRDSYVRFNLQGMDAAGGPDGNGTTLP
ncbi:MAG TPA: hypothetical protein VIX38_06390 [Nitrososphaeraceae archaeon]